MRLFFLGSSFDKERWQPGKTQPGRFNRTLEPAPRSSRVRETDARLGLTTNLGSNTRLEESSLPPRLSNDRSADQDCDRFLPSLSTKKYPAFRSLFFPPMNVGMRFRPDRTVSLSHPVSLWQSGGIRFMAQEPPTDDAFRCPSRRRQTQAAFVAFR